MQVSDMNLYSTVKSCPLGHIPRMLSKSKSVVYFKKNLKFVSFSYTFFVVLLASWMFYLESFFVPSRCHLCMRIFLFCTVHLFYSVAVKENAGKAQCVYFHKKQSPVCDIKFKITMVGSVAYSSARFALQTASLLGYIYTRTCWMRCDVLHMAGKPEMLRHCGTPWSHCVQRRKPVMSIGGGT
jgi:hypothetical protein